MPTQLPDGSQVYGSGPGAVTLGPIGTNPPWLIDKAMAADRSAAEAAGPDVNHGNYDPGDPRGGYNAAYDTTEQKFAKMDDAGLAQYGVKRGPGGKIVSEQEMDPTKRSTQAMQDQPWLYKDSIATDKPQDLLSLGITPGSWNYDQPDATATGAPRGMSEMTPDWLASQQAAHPASSDPTGRAMMNASYGSTSQPQTGAAAGGPTNGQTQAAYPIAQGSQAAAGQDPSSWWQPQQQPAKPSSGGGDQAAMGGLYGKPASAQSKFDPNAQAMQAMYGGG